MQIYAEAESNANEFIRFVLPRRNSICGEAKYTQKPRAEQMNLFKLLCFPWVPRGFSGRPFRTAHE